MPAPDLRPTRRAALVAGTVMALSACGVRLEDGAPHVPLVPTREPIPAEIDLLALLTGTRRLEKLAGQTSGSVAAALAGVHAGQGDVIAAALVRAGVPAADVAAADVGRSPSPTGSSSGSMSPTTGTAGARAADLGAAEAGSLGSARPLLARVQSDLVATVTALFAQRRASAQVLGARVARTDASTWSDPAAAVPFLTATRSAVYGFEVVAAQVGSAGSRSAARAGNTLTALRLLVTEQEDASGPKAPDPALGYALPFPVTDPRSARRLARRLLTDLRSTYAAHLAVAGTHRSVVEQITGWLADAQREVERWGGAPEPFPGLTLG